jgi:small neutral amino acid transporter SnatA (MarC family)
VTVETATTLWQREAPEASPMGVVFLILSLFTMPLIARASRKVARALGHDGGMWIWTIVGVLLIVFLVAAILRLLRR